MRIFGLVFGGLILATLCMLGYWFGKDTVVLEVASFQFQQSLSDLKRLSGGQNTKPCFTSSATANELVGVQLRFVSDVSYVIETVCTLPNTGSTLETGTLFGGVKRLYGSGVLLSSNNQSQSSVNGWVHLTFGKKVIVVGYFDGVIQKKVNVQGIPIGGDDAAQGECTNWGFTCCKQGAEKGFGAKVNAYDCQGNCFERCNQVPIILFFNTDPLLDTRTRTLLMKTRKLTVRFGFEITDFDGNIKQVSLDYGDGSTNSRLQSKETSVAHTYTCSQGRCTYLVDLEATDNDGNPIFGTALNRVTVILDP